MQKLITLFLLLILPLFAHAQTTPATAPASQPAKIKLLVITGGHGFNAPGFTKLFDNFTDTDTLITAHSKPKESADALDRPDLLSYDIVLFYDAPDTLSDSQKKNFLALLDHGTGLIVLHHALLSYQKWPEYERVAGGKYLLSTEKITTPDGKETTSPESTYQGNADIHVSIAPQKHPVTAGLADFDMKDEIYRGVRYTPDITPLLIAENHPLAWARTEKNSRIVSLIIGHGPGTWSNPNFLKFLTNTLHWTAKRDTPAQ